MSKTPKDKTAQNIALNRQYNGIGFTTYGAPIKLLAEINGLKDRLTALETKSFAEDPACHTIFDRLDALEAKQVKPKDKTFSFSGSFCNLPEDFLKLKYCSINDSPIGRVLLHRKQDTTTVFYMLVGNEIRLIKNSQPYETDICVVHYVGIK